MCPFPPDYLNAPLYTFPMVHFGRTEAPTFKNMAEPFLVLKLAPDSEVSENQSAAKSEDTLVKRRLSFSSEKEISSREETSLTYLDLSLQSLPDDLNSSSQPSEEKLSVKAPNGTDICSEQCGGNKGNTQGNKQCLSKDFRRRLQRKTFISF